MPEGGRREGEGQAYMGGGAAQSPQLYSQHYVGLCSGRETEEGQLAAACAFASRRAGVPESLLGVPGACDV